MPSCVMRWCRNYGTKNDGITYHKIPVNEEMKNQWTKIIRAQRSEPNWVPTNYAEICSAHFRPEDRYSTSKGYMRLKKNAVPIVSLDELPQTATLISLDYQNTLNSSMEITPKIKRKKKQLKRLILAKQIHFSKRFPSDPIARDKWIQIIRPDRPNDSEHSKSKSLTKNVPHKKLKKWIEPTLYVPAKLKPKYPQSTLKYNDIARLSHPPRPWTPRELRLMKKCKQLQDIIVNLENKIIEIEANRRMCEQKLRGLNVEVFNNLPKSQTIITNIYRHLCKQHQRTTNLNTTPDNLIKLTSELTGIDQSVITSILPGDLDDMDVEMDAVDDKMDVKEDEIETVVVSDDEVCNAVHMIENSPRSDIAIYNEPTETNVDESVTQVKSEIEEDDGTMSSVYQVLTHNKRIERVQTAVTPPVQAAVPPPFLPSIAPNNTQIRYLEVCPLTIRIHSPDFADEADNPEIKNELDDDEVIEIPLTPETPPTNEKEPEIELKVEKIEIIENALISPETQPTNEKEPEIEVKLEQNEYTEKTFHSPNRSIKESDIKTEIKMEEVDESIETTTYNHTIADQPGEPMALTHLPLVSRSNIPTEAQDVAASTSTTLFSQPPTVAAPKSKAQKQREYRRRIAASRTPAQAITARKSDAERQRKSRLRKAVNLAFVSGSLDTTTASSSHSNDVQISVEPAQIIQPVASSDQIEVQQTQWNSKWASSIMRFKSTFLDNDFGYACSVCDRLWCKNDLKPITAAQLEVISEWFIKENRQLCSEEYEMVCNTCKRMLNKKSMPPLAKVNGFSYPDRPASLPPLDPISERLISPRLPFKQVRRLRHNFSYGIVGQAINVPVHVQEMAKCLPRQPNEDDVINVNFERNLAHNSVYISEYISKSTISAWLTELQKSPLYSLYKINVDLSRLHRSVPSLDDIQNNPSNRIENISAENTPESEILASKQHSMMWTEEDCLIITPGHQAVPLNVIYDRHAEELSFPSIYFGEPRRFNKGVPVTPHMIASSEIRRRDRRGATPQKILYVAMKILRLRMQAHVDGIYSTFRNVLATENVTRRMLEDPEFLKEYVIQNPAFMKTVPNSVQYWASRKRDLFAMIRQLGKPTVFLSISANEIRWMKLLTILLKLSKKYPGKTAKDLNTFERCALVSDDPVTCCIYFYKLVTSLMKMLKSKQSYNPFGKYFVKDYFLRIEFQHRGSPHAHILLWLNDDPRETVSENMPKTIELVEKLSSVARNDVPNDSIYANQIHKHTLTCTKRGDSTCKFGIPHWPMPTTRVLVPIPESDERQNLQQKAKELRASLGERQYVCMDDFLNANSLTYDSYLDIIRSTLERPTLVFKRNFDELMTNTFNPYLAGEVNSSMDIQFILDDNSCAEYVVKYVTKSARGMGDLRRELTTMMEKHPDQDNTGQLKALSNKLLNAIEMSAQEAAWYLLRQPVSETSRPVVYIPTVMPTERPCCRKRRRQMDREGIDGDSTDVWTKNVIQRYEERPESLQQVYLAEFASWYASANDFVDEEDDVSEDVDDDSESVPEARTSKASKEYRKRPLGRVIRYRRYDINDTVDYKREMVLLYVPFRNELSEIVDQNKFLQLFDENKDTIMERHSLFETNLNIENVTKKLEATMVLQDDYNSNLQE